MYRSALAGEDLFDRLPSIHVPTLVLSGSQDWLKDCQPALIKSMTGVLPTVRVIENSSHFPHIEQVEEHNSKSCESALDSPLRLASRMDRRQLGSREVTKTYRYSETRLQ